MDCKTATSVYTTPNPLNKIQEIFPQAWAFFHSECQAFVNKSKDNFDVQVKQIVGPTDFDYRITHRDEGNTLGSQIQELVGDQTSRLLLEDHFSTLYKTPVFFATMCCDGHSISSKALNMRESLRIQKAAVSLQ